MAATSIASGDKSCDAARDKPVISAFLDTLRDDLWIASSKMAPPARKTRSHGAIHPINENRPDLSAYIRGQPASGFRYREKNFSHLMRQLFLLRSNPNRRIAAYLNS